MKAQAATLPLDFPDIPAAAPAAIEPELAEAGAALWSYLERYGRLELPGPAVAWEDPRPDLAGDSPTWQTALKRAYVVDGQRSVGAFVGLYMARLAGAHLVRGPGGALKIEAPAGLGAAEWQKLRAAHLLPNRAQIEQVLSTAGKR